MKKITLDMSRIFFLLIFISLSILVQGQTISNTLIERWESSVRVECIVVLKDQLDLYGSTNGMTKDEKAIYVYQTLKAHAIQSQRLLLADLHQKGVSHKSFFAFNGIHAWLTQEEAEYLIDEYDIERIIPNVQTRVDRPMEDAEDFATSRMDAEWGITQIKADTVWEMGIRGAGVIVAGQDTGYDYTNPAILSKYQGFSEDTIVHDYSWHDAIHELNPMHGDTDNDPSNNPCGIDLLEPCDDNAHGSHTMGTMVGGNDTLKIGVAPDAKWIACRNMDRGYGSPVTYTECYEWFLAPTDINGNNPDPTKAPHVINNSWGCPPIEGCDPSNFFMMETVINNLTAAGTVVVVSAGNDGGQGCSTIRNPSAIFENSFAVGASRQNDSKAGFSSIGPVEVDSSYRIKPDVVAPGVNVLSINNQGGFNSWGGTSMAGPHVAGAVALIISANPDLAGEVDMIKDILKTTAVTLVDSTECGEFSALDVPNFYYGYGRIDVLAAVEMAINIPCTVEAGDDLTICNTLDTMNINFLNGELLSSNVNNFAWSSEPTSIGSFNYYGSDMMTDTSMLAPQLTEYFERTEIYYLTGVTSTGVTCIDSVAVQFSDWSYLTILPESGKTEEDTVSIYSIAGSNWPMIYEWSPNYNISDTSVAQPNVWNDTTQYYNVKVTDSLGCVVETGWLVNVQPSDIKDLEKSISLSIYPNPNQGDFLISTDKGIVNNVELFDAAGKKVYSQKGSSNTMNIEGIQSGIYLYRAQVSGQIVSGKIVVIEK